MGQYKWPAALLDSLDSATTEKTPGKIPSESCRYLSLLPALRIFSSSCHAGGEKPPANDSKAFVLIFEDPVYALSGLASARHRAAPNPGKLTKKNIRCRLPNLQTTPPSHARAKPPAHPRPHPQPPTMDLLRSTLQPLTHALPPPLRTLGLSLLGPSCYKTLILDLDPSSSTCLKLALSKSLGIGIVATSSIVKVPQIGKLLRSQSAAGVSFLSYLLETGSLLISWAYNVRRGFPFSTYGELALIAAQNVVIAVLVLRFAGQGVAAGVFVAGLAAAGYALFDTRVVDAAVLSYLQAGAGALGVASKMPQIWTVWQQGGTGQLSAFAVGGSVRGMREVADGVLGVQLFDGIGCAHLYDGAGDGRSADLL